MGWGQRSCRFIAQFMQSDRQHQPFICGDGGIRLVVAGEFGSLEIALYSTGPTKGEDDYFSISLQPWRSSSEKISRYSSILLCSGKLNFEETGYNEKCEVRVDKRFKEVMEFLQAEQIMSKGVSHGD
jgi:hypothetical protein